MTKKTTATALLAIFSVGAALVPATQAQRSQYGPQQTENSLSIQTDQTAPRLLVDPGFQQPPYFQPAPKLGFQGQIIHGFGMKVVSVNWGSAAQRAGLESGDIITRINGRSIRSQWDYDQALTHAAQFKFGQIHMKVRNVRYDWGHNVPMFAHVQTVLDGFGGAGPVLPQLQAAPQEQQTLPPASNVTMRKNR